MTLRRIALPLMGTLTLGALPASAGMLSFNAPDGNVSTTASFAEGGVTVKVCGYTYARFGNSEESPQSGVDVERLASLFGIDGSAVDGVASTHGSATANGHHEGAESVGDASGSFGGNQGFGGNGNGWAGGWGSDRSLGDLLNQKNNGSGYSDKFGGTNGFPNGGFGPGGPFDTPSRHFDSSHDDDKGDPQVAETQHMPEPATLALLGSGLIASRLIRRRKQQS